MSPHIKAVESASEENPEYSYTPKREYVYETPEQFSLHPSSNEDEGTDEENVRQFAKFNCNL
jgi:hypothetical protein